MSECKCIFVSDGQKMDNSICPIHGHQLEYPCDLCDCRDYRPRNKPYEKHDGWMHWPLCVCGHVAQDHN